MPLRAIAYVSRALPDLSARRLQALVDDAARFNKMAGVTGVLLHDGGRFLQYLEGPPDGIGSVYERILQAGRPSASFRTGRCARCRWRRRCCASCHPVTGRALPVRCRVIAPRRRRWTCSTTLCSQHCTPAERQPEAPPPQ